MTNKQFVLSICPTAYVKKFYGGGWLVLNLDDCKVSKWDTQSSSANGAWRLAKKAINEKIMKKFEL